MKHYINNGKAYSYEYDAAGNISKIQSPDGSYVTYTYDALNQLIKETYSTCLPLSGEVASANAEDGGVVSYDTIEYSYDSRGNILSKTYLLGETTVETITYGYTDTAWKDRLTSYNGVTITADEIGNPLTWHDGSTMSWQHGRQLASLTKNGVTSTYVYNVDGIRTRKTVGGVTTNYYVIDGSLRRLTDGTNTLQFIYGNGLSSVIFNGTEYWYVYNAQNDVIGLINASGSYVVQYTYDAWGKPLSKTGTLADTLGSLNPFRYRGYIYDEESGFYYCQARYYDSEIGRFINSDNEALVITTPESASWDKNLFAYCDNNPIMRYDIGGEFWNYVIGGVVGGIVGGVVAAINNGDASDIIVGVVSGAASGVVAASGLSWVAQAGISAAISASADVAIQMTDIVQTSGDLSDYNILQTVEEASVGFSVSAIGSGLGALMGSCVTKTSKMADELYDKYLEKAFTAGMRAQTGRSSSALLRQADGFLKQSVFYDNITRGVSSVIGSVISFVNVLR